MTGRHRGERLGACTDCRRFWARYRAGGIDAEEISEVEGKLAVTAGTCAVMGTASTMACLTEALGFACRAPRRSPRCMPTACAPPKRPAPRPCKLIGLKLTPARLINARIGRERAARAAGDRRLDQCDHPPDRDRRPRRRKGLARTAQRLSDTTPVLVNLKPVGNGYMEDFCSAGGMGALLRELKPLLHLDCMTVTGETLGERLAATTTMATSIARSSPSGQSRSNRRAAWSRCSAISRRRARSSNARRPTPDCSSTRAGRWCSLRWRISPRASTIPTLDVEPADILVLQNAGPHAPACMPEAGYLPIPKKLAQKGVKDMVRISDARMSGTAFGTIVLHVTPDAASGGPLGLVQNGDRIRLSVKERSIALLVDEAELKKRAAAARPAAENRPSAATPNCSPSKFSAPTKGAISSFSCRDNCHSGPRKRGIQSIAVLHDL